jgi:hypothetical protein
MLLGQSGDAVPIEVERKVEEVEVRTLLFQNGYIKACTELRRRE